MMLLRLPWPPHVYVKIPDTRVWHSLTDRNAHSHDCDTFEIKALFQSYLKHACIHVPDQYLH